MTHRLMNRFFWASIENVPEYVKMVDSGDWFSMWCGGGEPWAAPFGKKEQK